MHRWWRLLVALALAALIPVLMGQASLQTVVPLDTSQKSQTRHGLDGTYVIDPKASDAIDAAIDTTVKPMSFIIRGVARGRLKKSNPLFQSIAIGRSEGALVVTTDNLPIRAPGSGLPVTWVRPTDGESFRVSHVQRGDKLVQTFVAKDGKRVNTLSLGPDGNTLNMDVQITSPRLPKPLEYRLVFKRER